MIKSSLHQRLSILVLGCSIALGTWSTFLQMPASAQETATIRIRAGETLEIATDAVSPNAQFSWILTKDRKFHTAQRTRFFQTRIAEPGNYSLDVSIQNAATGENTYRAFSIIVTEGSAALPPELPVDQTQLAKTAVLTTDPSAIQGVVYLGQAGGMVKVDASKSTGKIGRYAVDLNTYMDSNGDGDPTNDVDNEGTLSERSGSPFYLYAIPSGQPRIIGLVVSDVSDIDTAKTQLSFAFGNNPPVSSSSATPTPGQEDTPIAIAVKGMTVELEALLDEDMVGGRQILLEWDFGDRSKSLLDRPLHTYAFPGSYTIALIVKDIETADVLYEGTTTVNILPSAQGSSSSLSASSISTSSSSETSEPSKGGSTGAIFTVALIILLLLMLAAGLYALFTWIKKRTALSIQRTLEKVEESIVKKDPKEGVIDVTEPMKMKKYESTPALIDEKKTDIIEKENSRKEMRGGEQPTVAPAITPGPVPDWLKKPAVKTDNAKKLQSPETRQETVQEPPKKVPAPPVQKQHADGPMPDWLKPSAKQNATPAPKQRPPAEMPKAKAPAQEAPLDPRPSEPKEAEAPAAPKAPASKPIHGAQPSAKKTDAVANVAITSPVGEKKQPPAPQPKAPTPKPSNQSQSPSEKIAPVEKVEKNVDSNAVVEEKKQLPTSPKDPTSKPSNGQQRPMEKAEPVSTIVDNSPPAKEKKQSPESMPIQRVNVPVKEAPKDDDPPIAIIQADSISSQ